jgi:SRSO17 transposase
MSCWAGSPRRFGRVEPRQRAKALVHGLLADLPRKNCWTIAEHAGDPNPDGMQHLLARAVWDEDAVRDDVRGYLVEHLGDPAAVLVIDETGDLKKGTGTAGVQRQYTGTAGRVENAQVGFATKPALATAMVARALDAGVPAAWVTGEEVYGACPGLRAALEARGIGYVLAVACDHLVRAGGVTQRADALLRCVPARAWQCVSAGRGANGHRHYDWAFLRLDDGKQVAQHWLLVRRHQRTGELAFYRCFMPHPVPLAALVRVAGRRWTIEERFQTNKGLVGLDQHQVRRWRSWHRWVTLAMLAHAFPVVTAVTEHARHPPPGLISLTCNELQHLFAALVAVPLADPDTDCAGRCGGADTKPAPAPATTDDKPPPGNHEARLPAVTGWPAGQGARAAAPPTLPRHTVGAAAVACAHAQEPGEESGAMNRER